MYSFQIFKGKDLKAKSLEELARLFGKSGIYYYNVVRGIHHGEVKPHRIQKSVGVEHTFWDDINEDEELYQKLNR